MDDDGVYPGGSGGDRARPRGPISHQNNLLVMGPGGYHFGDCARADFPLVPLLVFVSAAALALTYG